MSRPRVSTAQAAGRVFVGKHNQSAPRTNPIRIAAAAQTQARPSVENPATAIRQQVNAVHPTRRRRSEIVGSAMFMNGSSLADTEVAEDVVENIIGINFAQHRAQFQQRATYFEGDQFVSPQFPRDQSGLFQ